MAKTLGFVRSGEFKKVVTRKVDTHAPSYREERAQMKRALNYAADEELIEKSHSEWYRRQYQEDHEKSLKISEIIRAELDTARQNGAPYFLPATGNWHFINRESRPFINDSHLMRTNTNTERLEEMLLADEFGFYQLKDYGSHEESADRKINKTLREMYKEYDQTGVLTNRKIVGIPIGEPYQSGLEIDIRNWCGEYKGQYGKQVRQLQPLSPSSKEGMSFKSFRSLCTWTKHFQFEDVLLYRDVIDYFQWDFKVVQDINLQVQKFYQKPGRLKDRTISDWKSAKSKHNISKRIREEIFKPAWEEVSKLPWEKNYARSKTNGVLNRFEIATIERVRQSTIKRLIRQDELWSGAIDDPDKIKKLKLVYATTGIAGFSKAVDENIRDLFREAVRNNMEQAFWPIYKKAAWRKIWGNHKHLSRKDLFVKLNNEKEVFLEKYPESKTSITDLYDKIVEPEILVLKEKLSVAVKISGSKKIEELFKNISNQDLLKILNGSATGSLRLLEDMLRQVELSWHDLSDEDEEACVEDGRSQDDHDKWNPDDMTSDELMEITSPLKSIDQAGFTYWHTNKIPILTEKADLLFRDKRNNLFREAIMGCKKEAASKGSLKRNEKYRIKNTTGFDIGWNEWNELQFAIQRAGI